MANYWRGSEGREVIETAARWVVEQAAFRGCTVHDYIEGRCSLVDMGVSTENAAATLKPRKRTEEPVEPAFWRETTRPFRELTNLRDQTRKGAGKVVWE